MVFSSPVRPWLLPNFVLLVLLTVWGVVRYPHLPDRIPQHIGTGGVDAWTDRSVGSAFLLVFTYVGVTVLMIASAELTLRVTPRDELTPSSTPFANAASAVLNRPASRASARRLAQCVLLLNACVGVSFAGGCWVLWRSRPEPGVPGWLPVVLIAPIVAGTALTVAVAMRDHRRSRR